MPKIQKIQREPATTADKEAQKVLASNSAGGIRITGPAAPHNRMQDSGTQVSGGGSISGGTGRAPSKTQGKITN